MKIKKLLVLLLTLAFVFSLSTTIFAKADEYVVASIKVDYKPVEEKSYFDDELYFYVFNRLEKHWRRYTPPRYPRIYLNVSKYFNKLGPSKFWECYYFAVENFLVTKASYSPSQRDFTIDSPFHKEMSQAIILGISAGLQARGYGDLATRTTRAFSNIIKHPAYERAALRFVKKKSQGYYGATQPSYKYQTVKRTKRIVITKTDHPFKRYRKLLDKLYKEYDEAEEARLAAARAEEDKKPAEEGEDEEGDDDDEGWDDDDDEGWDDDDDEGWDDDDDDDEGWDDDDDDDEGWDDDDDDEAFLNNDQKNFQLFGFNMNIAYENVKDYMVSIFAFASKYL